MYKLIRRILSGRKLVGYLITDGTCVRQINLSEAKGLSQDGLLSKVSYDQRNDRLVGKGIDLRSLGTVQISQLNKDKLENNKVNYRIVKSGAYVGEKVGLIRVKDTKSIQIKNVRCDQLIIYSTETAVCCPHIDIDYRTVKVKNLVLVNINESLFDMLYPLGVKKFIDRLDSINYIKSDGFQTIHTGKGKSLELKGLDFRYKLTNTNWYKGITSEVGFIYDYREFISENYLDLTVYMNKLYNDKVVRQIVNGEILLELDRYLSNTNTQAIREHLNFWKFEKQLRLRGLYGKDKLKDNGIDDDFQLMAFRLDNYTVGDSEQFPDALIDIDLETVNKLIEDCTDFQTLRKLIFPNTQVFRIIGKGNKVYEWFELRQYTLKYTENLSNLYKKQYEDRKCSIVTNSQTVENQTQRVTMNNNSDRCNEYKQIIDIPYISELLYPLESKLNLLNIRDSGKSLDDKQYKRTQELVQSKILRYLLDLYRKNRNLEQYMSSILIELLYKYCRADDILIDNKICVNYRGTGGYVGYGSLTSIYNSLLNVNNYDIEIDSIDALLETPDLSVFITDADMLLALGIKSNTGDCTITQAGRKIEQFDLGNYNFVNLRSLNNMFSGARLKKLILDGKQFNSQRIRSIDGMLSNAKIDEVIIKNMDFRQVKNCYGFMLAFNGKLIILNQLLNDHMLGFIESFRSQIILSKINESVERMQFITDDPSIRYCRLNETKLISDGHTNKIVWKSYNQSLLDYGDSTRKQRDDYIKLNKG